MNPPPKLDLARLPTPLQPLDRLSEALGGPRIWIKRDDLTEAAGAGNKIRKLEFVLADALNQGATALITSGGLQSNHCRATALFAAQLGLQCHLILRGADAKTANGNLLLNQLLGAKIDYVSDQAFEHLDGLYERKVVELSGLGERPYRIPIGASDELGLWGYILSRQGTGRRFYLGANSTELYGDRRWIWRHLCWVIVRSGALQTVSACHRHLRVP